MSVWRALILVLLVFAAPLLARPASAHQATLGVLEFREMRPGMYIGRWTTLPKDGDNRIELRMPAHCFLRLPELNCGDKGLVGQMTIANLGEDMSAAIIRITSIQDDTSSYTISAANPVVTIIGTGAPTLETWLELAKTYVNLGMDHILLGADHLLFVLGLIWIVQGGWRLFKTITAFTIGHSASLAATAFGWIGVPEGPLNACIALSIVFVGVEIVRQQRGEIGLTARYPWAVAFSFGLVHGIGFASALAGLGLERRILPAALLFFNVGVEIGQILFVMLVLALISAHRRLGAVMPRWSAELPAYAIGSVSMFWFLGRLARVLAAA
ncbi:membrane protein [Bradyrhizobium sp. SSBR45G]|uniref:HupE/UreJ family protein n=1 Tax=unclassified Bradyrhizobium TaxID=2631580 RepID=UPI002342B6E2|nr:MULTISPECIES: HupE/UreJ family protein [unclassified Bradyrhizobium]GLH76062.1 membrane protein [Bradyrhizobium sp. SSBR45G]GLH83454.1 membrane protein [Bradyrhizobium sp. SSBR45R]